MRARRKTPTNPLPTEHAEQVALVNKLRAKGYLVFAIPNGGARNPIGAARLKAEGVLPGVPDLCVLLSGGRLLWVEMKRAKGGRISKAQKAMHKAMDALGHRVFVYAGTRAAMLGLGLVD